MKKEITLQLDSDAITYIEKMSECMKCSPSDFVEHLIAVNMAFMKNQIERLLPHHDFEPGGIVNVNPNSKKCGEMVLSKTQFDKLFNNESL